MLLDSFHQCSGVPVVLIVEAAGCTGRSEGVVIGSHLPAAFQEASELNLEQLFLVPVWQEGQ